MRQRGHTLLELLIVVAIMLATATVAVPWVRAFSEEASLLGAGRDFKGDFRLAKKPTQVGGVHIPAGSFLYIANSAANRDSRRFSNPGEFQIEREDARLHVAFGRGRHTCPGAPLARAEAVVAINRMFDHTRDIRIDEKVHGPAGARKYGYLPTFILRGLTHINLQFDPIAGGPR